MLLTTFDPFAEFHRALRTADGGHAAMRMDAIRREQEIELRFDLPGIDTDSIDVTVDRGVLTVSAKRPRSTPRARSRSSGSGSWARSRGASGCRTAWTRRRSLPSYDGGVLRVTRSAAGAGAAAQGRGQHRRQGRSRGLIRAITCEGPVRLRPRGPLAVRGIDWPVRRGGSHGIVAVRRREHAAVHRRPGLGDARGPAGVPAPAGRVPGRPAVPVGWRPAPVHQERDCRRQVRRRAHGQRADAVAPSAACCSSKRGSASSKPSATRCARRWRGRSHRRGVGASGHCPVRRPCVASQIRRARPSSASTS